MDDSEHPGGHPDVFRSARRDLTDWARWSSRIIVMGHAGAAGLAVVAFTWLSESALQAFHAVQAVHPLAPLFWTPLLTAFVAWACLRFAPGTSGSGIPHVMAALSSSMPPGLQAGFVSLRLSLAKLLLTCGSMLGGLPVGREGPAVQIAAGIMLHARRWLPERSAITPHGLLVAGGAAGVAAAFNAPLAGVMFAIEQLTTRVEERSSGLIVAAIVFAGLVAVSIFGNATYFGVIHVPGMHWALLGPALLVVAVSGVAGGLFARLLLSSLLGDGDRWSRLRRAHPVAFAAACGVAIAVIGLASGGSAFGGGYQATRGLIEGATGVPLLDVLLRFVATWIAAWSGISGGVFAPALAIGAGVGSDVAQLSGASPAAAPALIAIGMVAFLAAVTRAPMTSFIIVMEMVDGHAMVLSLMASAMAASMLARWFSRPLYAELARVMLARAQAVGQPAQDGPPPAQER